MPLKSWLRAMSADGICKAILTNFILESIDFNSNKVFSIRPLK
jgi:hypothetical protein